MFSYKNPDADERQQISRDYPGTSIDWSKFGKARDEGGLTFLEEHYNVNCNYSEQNSFHTKSTFDATIAAFLRQRRWLAKKRGSFVQSDNASNYRDPTTEIDLECVGARCFSEAGMTRNNQSNKPIACYFEMMTDGGTLVCGVCASRSGAFLERIVIAATEGQRKRLLLAVPGAREGGFEEE
jgi:hypothetical protein